MQLAPLISTATNSQFHQRETAKCGDPHHTGASITTSLLARRGTRVTFSAPFRPRSLLLWRVSGCHWLWRDQHPLIGRFGIQSRILFLDHLFLPGTGCRSWGFIAERNIFGCVRRKIKCRLETKDFFFVVVILKILFCICSVIFFVKCFRHS